MEIDLDKSLIPWDLDLRIKGTLYKTLPMTLADAAVLVGMVTEKVVDAARLAPAVLRLFDPASPPPLAELDASYLMNVLGVIVNYWKALISKNSAAIAPLLAAAMAGPTTSGTSGSSTPQCC